MASSIKISILELDGVEYDTPVEYDFNKALEDTGWIRKAMPTNATNSSSTTWVQPSTLSESLIAGKVYNISWCGIFSAAAGGTGLSLSLQGSASFTNLAAVVEIPTSTTAVYRNVFTALNAAINSASNPAANSKYLCQVKGTFLCSSSGTIGLAFRSEVNGSAITMYAGSNIEVTEVI